MVMAQIDVLTGDYDAAIDELEYLLSIQTWWTTTYMEADPYLEPLHDLPRFKLTMDKYRMTESL